MTFEALRRAQDGLRLAAGVSELGSLLWWQLACNQIEHDRLAAAAAVHGLDARHLPAPVKPCGAFRRAVRHLATQLPQGQMLRGITEDANEIVVGLVEERSKAAERDLQYNVLVRIVFSKTSEHITADADHLVTEQLRSFYHRHLDHTTDDVRAMMTSFLGGAGVSLREAGGVYFVPAAHGRQLEALCRVVEEVGRNRTFRLPIVDTPTTRGTLREVAERSLDEEVRELEQELAAFDPEKVRDTTLERRLEKFEQLRSRAGLFADVLNFKADSISQRIAAMTVQVRRHLGLEAPEVPPTALPLAAALSSAFQSASATIASDVGF